MVFDVGGNIGQSILHYRNALPECRIHSFEPNPDAFAELESQWGDCGEVSLVRLALAEKAGVMDFYATRRSEMSSLLVPEPWLNILSPDRKYDFTALQVQCGTLDAYCKEMNIDHVDILKIDVQGGELRVLEGGGGLLAAGRVGLIYLEVNLAATYVDQMSLAKLLEYLEPLGYQLWDVLPFVYTGAGRAWTANALFVCPEWVKVVENAARGTSVAESQI